MTLRVLIACPHLQRDLPRYLHRFAEHGIEVEAPPVEQQLSEPYLIENIARFDGVIAGDDHFTARVFEHAQRLRVIAKWGIGVDNIDLAAARSRGVKVLNTPGQLSGEVAEVVIGYLILLARRLHEIDNAVHAGDWRQIRGTSLAGKTLGIVGLGAIGKAVASRALAFEMKVLAYDPYATSTEVPGVSFVDLSQLIADSHFVSLNCSLTPETRHLIGAPAFAGMRRGAYLVNTSRGALIDEQAMVQALEDGVLAGAALDVFEQEPLPADSPLRRFGQCIFGAHNSSNTQEAVDRINELAVQNLLVALLDEAER